MKTKIVLLIALLAVVTSAVTAAQPTPSTSAAAAGASAMTNGEVRKVDRDAQKLTLRHGPIANLDMPAMTMVFRVSDPVMLDNVQVGDQVRFRVENVGGQLTVTRIEPANG